MCIEMFNSLLLFRGGYRSPNMPIAPPVWAFESVFQWVMVRICWAVLWMINCNGSRVPPRSRKTVQILSALDCWGYPIPKPKTRSSETFRPSDSNSDSVCPTTSPAVPGASFASLEAPFFRILKPGLLTQQTSWFKNSTDHWCCLHLFAFILGVISPFESHQRHQ